MNCLKSAMWWAAVIGMCVGFGFCWLYVVSAINWQIEHDAYSHARISLMRALGIMFEIFAVMLATMGFVYTLIRLMWSNDPDVGTNDEGEYVFEVESSFRSPAKPR